MHHRCKARRAGTYLGTVLLASVGLASLSSVTNAGSRTASHQWTGFYIGGHGGAAWSHADASLSWGPGNYFTPGDQFALAVEAASRRNPQSRPGFAGGLQAGFNLHRGSALIGIETDVTWLGSAGWTNVLGTYPAPAIGDFTLTHSVNVNWMSTVRARVGFVADRLLIFATVGAAIANVEYSWTFLDTIAAVGHGHASKTSVRPVFGAGLEYAFTDRWSGKLDYLYTDLGALDATAVAGGFTASFFSNVVTGRANVSSHVARAGINYRFGKNP